MEKLYVVISIFERIEDHYKELKTLSNKLEKAILEKKSDELLDLLGQRESLLIEINKLNIELQYAQENFIEETNCKEFTLNEIQRVLNEQIYSLVSSHLKRINDLLMDIIKINYSNQENLQMVVEGIKLSLVRISSVKNVKKKYFNIEFDNEPHFFDLIK